MDKLQVFSKKLGSAMELSFATAGGTDHIVQSSWLNSGWSNYSDSWLNSGWNNYSYSWQNSGWNNYSSGWVNSGWSNYGSWTNGGWSNGK